MISLANQELTREWWRLCRPSYRLCVSELVSSEIGRGDVDAARQRVALIEGIPMLGLDDEAADLGDRILAVAKLPQRARVDALHIAAAARHGVDFVMTWNLKHIANAFARRHIEQACRDLGYEPPTLCTPAELLGEFAPDHELDD